MNDNNKQEDLEQKIEDLKNKARMYNISGNIEALHKVLTQLDKLWVVPKDSATFYAELESRSIAKGD